MSAAAGGDGWYGSPADRALASSSHRRRAASSSRNSLRDSLRSSLTSPANPPEQPKGKLPDATLISPTSVLSPDGRPPDDRHAIGTPHIPSGRSLDGLSPPSNEVDVVSSSAHSVSVAGEAQRPKMFWKELARARSDSTPSGTSWAAEWNQTAAHWQQQARSPRTSSAETTPKAAAEQQAAAEYARALREAEVRAVSCVEQMHAVETQLLASELQAEEGSRARETHKLSCALEQVLCPAPLRPKPRAAELLCARSRQRRSVAPPDVACGVVQATARLKATEQQLQTLQRSSNRVGIAQRIEEEVASRTAATRDAAAAAAATNLAREVTEWGQ